MANSGTSTLRSEPEAVTSLAPINHFVLAKQHLAPATLADDLVQVASDIGGLHATSATTPYLSLFARMRRFERSELDAALVDQRTLARVRCVRGTIYIHPISVLPFVLKATTGAVIRGSERFLQARGVSPEQFATLAGAIVRLLQGREMTAAAIKKALRSELDVSSVLGLLCDQNVLVRARRLRYALFAEWFGNLDLGASSEPEAVRRLVEHYLAAFGPASENDVAWWTGLTKRCVQVALGQLQAQIERLAAPGSGDELLMLNADGERLHKTCPPRQPVVNLLPLLDPYLMGYKERERYLDSRDRDYVFDRSGNATSTILVSGRVAGVWDVESGEAPLAKLFLFRRVDPGIQEEIRTQALRLGRFIFGREVGLRECASMVPLTERTAGGMMSPLAQR